MAKWNIDTITLYNYWYDKVNEIDRYEVTVLNNVNLVLTQGANITKSGLEGADVAKVFIKEKQLDKIYMQPKKWQQLTQTQKENYITFNPGYDFFVQGDTSAEDVTKDGFYNYMKNNYDNVFKITTVDIYKNVMPHFEIGGR